MIIAFTGAGISKESGIPTFEEQPGIRDTLTRDYANEHPKEYKEHMEAMMEVCNKAEPNDAHKALAEYSIQVITMNIDGLHQRAGSKNVLPIHGEYPDIVLYGDSAPRYAEAYRIVDKMGPEDVLLVIGSSGYTLVSNQIIQIARYRGADVVTINNNAATEVRKFIKSIIHLHR